MCLYAIQYCLHTCLASEALIEEDKPRSVLCDFWWGESRHLTNAEEMSCCSAGSPPATDVLRPFWLNCNTSSATPCTFFPFSFPGTALFALRRFLRRGVRIFGTHRPGEVRCGLETMVKPWNQNSLHRYARCASGCLCQLKLGAGHANRAKGSGSGKEKLGCLVLPRCNSWSIQWETINLVTCSSLTTGFTVASPSCKVPGTPHTTFWKHKSQKTHPHQWSSCQWVDQQYLSQKMSLE